jgi:DNA-binding HxlR family transcriptional regulator
MFKPLEVGRLQIYFPMNSQKVKYCHFCQYIGNESMRTSTTCPVQTTVDVIGGKWKPGIVFRLQNGTYRFGALKREMPWISERVLIRQLKELEADGVVTRKDYQEVPPRVEYSLSAYGETLRPLLSEVAAWGEAHLKRRS